VTSEPEKFCRCIVGEADGATPDARAAADPDASGDKTDFGNEREEQDF
jgi:hypothetical protein